MQGAFRRAFGSAYGVGWGLSKAILALALALALLTAPLSAEERQILAFGDSLTAGYGLAQGDGFAPQLEAWLRGHGAEVKVVNAGLSGDTSAGGAARIGWSLTPEIDAVLVELGGNDLLRGIAPAETRANLATILDAVTARDLPVLLIGLEAPGNFGAEYKAAFDAIFPALAREYGAALYPDFLSGLKALGPRSEVLETYMQPDGLHPNAQGVKVVVAAIGPEVLALLER